MKKIKNDQYWHWWLLHIEIPHLDDDDDDEDNHVDDDDDDLKLIC